MTTHHRVSAQQVQDETGRQYHIGLAPGEVAPRVLLVGDPARAKMVAEMFDTVRCERGNREYVTYTGTHQGLEVSVMGTGMGPDNMEIALVELSQIIERGTFIRCGTSGALQPEIELGDLVISQGAVRLENTSTAYVHEGYPAVAHPEVVLALVQAAHAAGAPHHLGMTATAPGFYGPQERTVPGFTPRRRGLLDELATQGVANLEMEVSSLLTLASVGKHRAGAVCGVLASRPRDTFIDDDGKRATERRCVEVGLAALHLLQAMGNQRGDAPCWHPGLPGG